MNTTAAVATLLHVATQAAVVALYPAVAVAAWRSGGMRRLSLVCIAATVFFVVIAALLATETLGNRIAATAGYGYVASRLIVAFVFIAGFPVAVASAAAVAIPATVRFVVAYLIVFAGSIAAWAAGVVLTVYAVPLFS